MFEAKRFESKKKFPLTFFSRHFFFLSFMSKVLKIIFQTSAPGRFGDDSNGNVLVSGKPSIKRKGGCCGYRGQRGHKGFYGFYFLPLYCINIRDQIIWCSWPRGDGWEVKERWKWGGSNNKEIKEEISCLMSCLQELNLIQWNVFNGKSSSIMFPRFFYHPRQVSLQSETTAQRT